MGAFAGAVQAQSSVTVYGIIDVGVVGSSYRGTSGTANASSLGNAASTGGPTTNASMLSIGQSAESTSRLGLRGSEDLGGGMSAIFTIETALNPNASASAFAFNRQTFAGLSDRKWGTITFGTQYTPIFDVMAGGTDAAQLNNLVGNMVYSGSLQSSTGTYNNGLGPWNGQTTAANDGMTAQNSAYVTRASNVLKFVTNRYSGLQGRLFYGQANNTNTQTQANYAGGAAGGGISDNTVIGAALDYTYQKAQLVAAIQRFKAYNPGGAVATNPALAASSSMANGTAGSYGFNTTDNQYYVAATYDFGILKGFLQYINRKVTLNQDSSYTSSRQASQVGVRAPISSNIQTYATWGFGNASQMGQSVPKNNFRGAQLGADYYLSKRTNLYAAYGTYNQSSNGSGAASSTATGAGAGTYATSGVNYALGVRHTF